VTGGVPELWTTAEAAAYLGATSTGSGRKTLFRLGVFPVSREPGRGGQNLYDAGQVRAARAGMPGRGKGSRNAVRTDGNGGETGRTLP
jgi:hypothetical protein